MTDSDSIAAVDGLFLGIDVGGTEVKVGLIDRTGRIVRQGRASTPRLKTPERIFRFAAEFAREEPGFAGNRSGFAREESGFAREESGFAREESGFAGDRTGVAGHRGRLLAVGLAVPGVLDTDRFMLREVVNLPGWLGVPLRDMLSASTRLPSVVVNDANAAAFAEHARRRLGDRSLALVTLGTGIGCGVVMRGSPYGGDHGCAGELGHITIDFGPDAIPCTCGSRGHLETYAGARGVIARMRTRLAAESARGVSSALNADDVSPRDLAELAESGNAICRELIDETARYVGSAIGLLGQTLDPAVVLLGGAMTFGGEATETGRAFRDGVRSAVRETTLVQVGENMTVDFASLGNDAGIVGAAMFAKQECEDWSGE